jgi:uncharacterized protein YjbI with pentapeptide repeats
MNRNHSLKPDRTDSGGIGVRNVFVAMAAFSTFAGVAAGASDLETTAEALSVYNTGFPAAFDSREALQRALAAEGSLAGADLSNLPLAGLDFTARDLTGTKWGQADLRGATFTQCDLAGADFAAAQLNGAVFRSCQLQEAVFAGSALAGVHFSSCDISGATFTDAGISGLTLEDVRLFPTGAAHLPAVREAIRLRGGPELSAAWLAAASGDAFAFTYDRNDRAAWPGTPMTSNPILLAAEAVGYDASYRSNMESAQGAGKELTAILRRGLVAVLPMRLAGGGLSGNTVEQDVWVVAYDMQRSGKTPQTVSIQTPFGPMQFGFEDLLTRWQGPWPTLEPVGAESSLGEFPVCAIAAQKREFAKQAIALRALRNAADIMNEPRSFASSSGGFGAYEALIQDLGKADVVVGDLVHWSGAPRQALAASRQLAAEFLREAAIELPEASRGPLEEAASLYDEVALLLLEEWPLPRPEAFEGENAVAAIDATADRRPHARAVLEEALARERRAVALLGQALAEAVRSP